MHIPRPGRLPGATLSGSAAQRLLDGGDGPPPLPQLLASANRPATAAELRGESAARAAFLSALQSPALPHDLQRRSPIHTTTTIMVAKAIATIALTASTAGGVALATSSTSAAPDKQDRTSVEQTTTTTGAPTAYLASATPAPLDDTAGELDKPAPDRTDPLGEADTSDQTGHDGTPEGNAAAADTLHATGLCQAVSNVSTDDHPGKAADSPALANTQCPDTDKPAGPPSAPPGNPDQRTGKPDTTGRPTEKADKTERSAKADKSEKSDPTEKSGRSADAHEAKTQPSEASARGSTQNPRNN